MSGFNETVLSTDALSKRPASMQVIHATSVPARAHCQEGKKKAIRVPQYITWKKPVPHEFSICKQPKPLTDAGGGKRSSSVDSLKMYYRADIRWKRHTSVIRCGGVPKKQVSFLVKPEQKTRMTRQFDLKVNPLLVTNPTLSVTRVRHQNHFVIDIRVQV